jgi:hypothetical protein
VVQKIEMKMRKKGSSDMRLELMTSGGQKRTCSPFLSRRTAHWANLRIPLLGGRETFISQKTLPQPSAETRGFQSRPCTMENPSIYAYHNQSFYGKFAPAMRMVLPHLQVKLLSAHRGTANGVSSD